MEKLFYQAIYDKRLKRSMMILEMLYKAKQDLTIKELAKSLHVSERTVTTTLEFTKTLLPDTFFMSISDKKVSFSSTDDQPIDVVIIEIAKQTISFRILKHAFLEDGLNLCELAEQLFVSESTLRSRIKHINKMLKQFGCSLSSNDVKFVGKEANIRYFIYAYFSEFQDFYFSVCEEQLQYCTIMYDNMKEAVIKAGRRPMNLNSPQVKRWLTVTSDRIKTDKFIRLDEAFVERICGRASYKIFREIYRDVIIWFLNKEEIPEAEFVWAYIMAFHSVVYRPEAEAELFRDEKDNEPYKRKISEILNQMIMKFEIKEEDKEQFLLLHTAYFINISLLTVISPVFQIGFPNVKDYVIKNLQDVYNEWFECLGTVPKDELFQLDNSQSVPVQLAMISSQFIYKQKSQADKILYLFEGEAGFISYMETLAKRFIPKWVKGTFVYSEPVTSELIERVKPDIIVHNYELPEKIQGCKMVRVSDVPQSQEWEVLKKLIVNLDKDN